MDDCMFVLHFVGHTVQILHDIDVVLYFMFLNCLQVKVCCQLIPGNDHQDRKNGKDETRGIVALQYVIERSMIVAALASGDIVSVDMSADAPLVEVVGCLPSGIQNMSWSPDQDVFVIVSGRSTCIEKRRDVDCNKGKEEEESKVILMTSCFDVVIESVLNPSETGSCQFVNVGWGSKATQFHGSEGKAAAKIVAPCKGSKLPSDDGRVIISWRRDGSFFATSSIDPEREHRVIRVWSREGILQYTSDVIDGIDAVLSWRPSQEIIGITQWTFNKRQVSFLEKNGLFLEGFPLPLTASTPSAAGDEITPKHLSWSNDSNIMSVIIHKKTSSNNLKQFLLFYTTKNHHWYLKHVQEFDEDIESGDGFVTDLIWDSIDPSTVHFCQRSGVYTRICFEFTISRSQIDSSIAVIDGKRVLVTPFHQRIIPPPMAGKIF